MPKRDGVVVVTGAGGFIGGPLIAAFRQQGRGQVRAVDIKPFEVWYQHFEDVENLQLDLNLKESCEVATRDAIRFTTSPQIWEGWASLRITKPCVCFRFSSIPTCYRQH